MTTAAEHARAYWASRDRKKFVVTATGGGHGSIRQWSREVFVCARTGQGAVETAKRRGIYPSPPRGYSVRLATWIDLGCTPGGAS